MCQMLYIAVSYNNNFPEIIEYKLLNLILRFYQLLSEVFWFLRLWISVVRFLVDILIIHSIIFTMPPVMSVKDYNSWAITFKGPR